MSGPTTAPVPAPRSPRAGSTGGPRGRSPRASGNFELNSWLFMRFSGVLLVVLVLGHLFINLMLGEGINAVDFAFVAGKWTNPFWQTWDLLMLWLAELHGVNGLRTIINDYAERDVTRFWLRGLLYLSAVIVLVLGTLVIFTFDPCIDPESTLSVCQ
ncbi:MAG TPA: succinate dehydrogenase hydrophobic membrane anchor subunit [Nocardioidaceae bacterium]|nr:succinate dehydrogenase hydrophobic membrane anchor subunit [Nocardioidaceae bacterium]